MNKILELFGRSTLLRNSDWQPIVEGQSCPFIGRKCYKVRKSDPAVSIGTCTVAYGKSGRPMIICPSRLLERRQIFTDSLHLLTTHAPGNELHIVPEVSIPGGNVDYFVVSASKNKVKDFVGIELQTLDTTGTVWPERQRLLHELGAGAYETPEMAKSYGINWKHTAKITLVQMHHKIHTFESLNKKLVLVLQDDLLAYMSREFQFSHMTAPASLGDAMHMHAYGVERKRGGTLGISLNSRISTDAEGVGICLGLRTDPNMEMAHVVAQLERKLSDRTLFSPA